MKRYYAPVASSFARWSIHPHRLTRVNSYRGGQRL